MFNQNKSILSGVPSSTLQQWLTEAQNAYKELVLGRRAVTVSYDGKSTTFTAGNKADLQEWIDLLQRALGINKGRRALRPYFR
jgi:gpW